MADYWTDFAKTGDPNGPSAAAWPRFTSEAEHIKVLEVGTGGDVADDLVGYHNTQCGFLDTMPMLQGYPFEYPAGPHALAGVLR